MGVKQLKLSVTGKGSYHDGDLVEGVCEIEIEDDDHEVDGIKVCCIGKARTEWVESWNKTLVGHSAALEIFKQETFLTSPQGLLLPGFYRLPFAFRLPVPISSSYESGLGYVRYWVEAEDIGHWIFATTYKVAIKVVQLIDSNAPQYLFPVAGKDIQPAFCCCCCASGPLTIDARTDRAAYCPNEIISITASFHNQSSGKRARPYARLVQRYLVKDYRGRTQESKQEFKLESVGGDDPTQNYIVEGGIATWDRAQFKIPEVIPSLDCGIIHVRYDVQLGLDVPRGFDLELYLPIIIATIPYQSMPISRQPFPYSLSSPPPGIGNWDKNDPPETLPSAAPLLPPQNIPGGGGYLLQKCFSMMMRNQTPRLDVDDHGHGKSSRKENEATNNETSSLLIPQQPSQMPLTMQQSRQLTTFYEANDGGQDSSLV